MLRPEERRLSSCAPGPELEENGVIERFFSADTCLRVKISENCCKNRNLQWKLQIIGHWVFGLKRFRVQSFRFRVSDFWCKVSGFEFRMSG